MARRVLEGLLFGIGMSEMVIILAVALLVFGPTRLPDVARSLAKGLRELRKAGDDLRASIDLDLHDDSPAVRRSPPRAHAVSSSTSDAAADQPAPAHITGSELNEPGPSPTAPDPWPRPAPGTFARGEASGAHVGADSDDHGAPHGGGSVVATDEQPPTPGSSQGSTGAGGRSVVDGAETRGSGVG